MSFISHLAQQDISKLVLSILSSTFISVYLSVNVLIEYKPFTKK